MKTKKKNRFLSFCFSVIPGAAEMYMGFMKTGLSLMLMFALFITIAVLLNQGILTLIIVVAWFYCFFHANHLASLSDEEFVQVKDEYLFGIDTLPGMEKFINQYRKWVAYLLIFIGACFLWSSITSLLYGILPEGYRFIARTMRMIGDYVPSLLIAFGIIFAGIKMISGKRVETEGRRSQENILENKDMAGKDEK